MKLRTWTALTLTTLTACSLQPVDAQNEDNSEIEDSLSTSSFTTTRSLSALVDTVPSSTSMQQVDLSCDPAHYEPLYNLHGEASDGKDNDCDGFTDETDNPIDIDFTAINGHDFGIADYWVMTPGTTSVKLKARLDSSNDAEIKKEKIRVLDVSNKKNLSFTGPDSSGIIEITVPMDSGTTHPVLVEADNAAEHTYRNRFTLYESASASTTTPISAMGLAMQSDIFTSLEKAIQEKIANNELDLNGDPQDISINYLSTGGPPEDDPNGRWKFLGKPFGFGGGEKDESLTAYTDIFGIVHRDDFYYNFLRKVDIKNLTMTLQIESDDPGAASDEIDNNGVSSEDSATGETAWNGYYKLVISMDSIHLQVDNHQLACNVEGTCDSDTDDGVPSVDTDYENGDSNGDGSVFDSYYDKEDYDIYDVNIKYPRITIAFSLIAPTEGTQVAEKWEDLYMGNKSWTIDDSTFSATAEDGSVQNNFWYDFASRRGDLQVVVHDMALKFCELNSDMGECSGNYQEAQDEDGDGQYTNPNDFDWNIEVENGVFPEDVEGGIESILGYLSWGLRTNTLLSMLRNEEIQISLNKTSLEIESPDANEGIYRSLRSAFQGMLPTNTMDASLAAIEGGYDTSPGLTQAFERQSSIYNAFEYAMNLGLYIEAPFGYDHTDEEGQLLMSVYPNQARIDNDNTQTLLMQSVLDDSLADWYGPSVFLASGGTMGALPVAPSSSTCTPMSLSVSSDFINQTLYSLTATYQINAEGTICSDMGCSDYYLSDWVAPYVKVSDTSSDATLTLQMDQVRILLEPSNMPDQQALADLTMKIRFRAVTQEDYESAQNEASEEFYYLEPVCTEGETAIAIVADFSEINVSNMVFSEELSTNAQNQSSQDMYDQIGAEIENAIKQGIYDKIKDVACDAEETDTGVRMVPINNGNWEGSYCIATNETTHQYVISVITNPYEGQGDTDGSGLLLLQPPSSANGKFDLLVSEASYPACGFYYGEDDLSGNLCK